MSLEKIARIRICLAEIEPIIWRRVDVPIDLSLKGLHDVIQAAFGWQDYHLFEFRVGDKLYGIPDPPEDYGRKIHHAKLAKLEALLARGTAQFEYIYDFGDDWEHVVEIESVMLADPALNYPRFVEGARRGPPEDVGSVPGYYAFLKAVSNPRHRDHRRMTEWYGGRFDPEDIGVFDIRLRLGAIAKRRYAGKAAYAKRNLNA